MLSMICYAYSMDKHSTRIYCDESCHLLHDASCVMTFGAIQCPTEKVREISLEIREIKKKYSCVGELKWTKVSDKNLEFYIELVSYFANQDCLNFRSLIVRNKEELDHDTFNNGEHDDFYYKMYYYLLRNVIEKKNSHTYEIFLDVKDTRSNLKVKKLRQVLSNSLYDFEMYRITRIQQIRSIESNLVQLCDFLLGAITYTNRKLNTSEAKLAVTNELSKQCKVCLLESTPPWETKFNLFHFTPRGEGKC